MAAGIGDAEEAPQPVAAAGTEADARRALKLLHMSLTTFSLGLALGTSWDVYWHSRYLTDSFWTPPHLFMYAGVSTAGLFAAFAYRSAPLRACFGEGIALPFLRNPVPGPLLLTGFGVAVTLFGGAMDDYWHTRWGLDETRWAFPHATIVWGILLAVLGMLSCRLALRGQIPISNKGWVLWGFLVTTFSMAVSLGPYLLSTTPESMARIAALPGFQGADTQHYFRIVERWQIYRTSPAFIIVVAAWVGFVLGFLRAAGLSWRAIIGVSAVCSAAAMAVGLVTASYVGTLGAPATWLPPLIFPAALAYAYADYSKLPAYGCNGTAAFAAGLMSVLLYGQPSAFALVGIAVGVGLGYAGAWTWGIVERPGRRGLAWLGASFGFAIPVAMGALDFFLRLSTP
jgi:hypothetical protein